MSGSDWLGVQLGRPVLESRQRGQRGSLGAGEVGGQLGVAVVGGLTPVV